VVGFAPAGPTAHGEAFTRWLAEGRHGGMAYLARNPERRLDASQIDPDIRSVVSLGMSYCQDDEASMPSDRPGPSGRIARYARGADYHNVLGRKLRKLLKELRESEDGVDGRWYVDTGPVMDRAWAARSGLGWWGKHTNLVSRTHGSWLVLGTLLLNRELTYDAPEKDFCGTCRRCIDVCPTKAITAERELDARLCISYLTIEHRGPIPVELRPAIGDWIFGCDLCLEVCPWNRFARLASEARFQSRGDRNAPALLPLLELTDPEFRVQFNGSPIQRARRDGFVRNVAVALGNVGGAESIEPLFRRLHTDPSPLVRSHAAWALGRVALRSMDASVVSRVRQGLEAVRGEEAQVMQEIEAAASTLVGM
jgi:epoxyqueuosine reductase